MDCLSAENVDAEEIIRGAQDAVRGKVGGEGAETLAIAGFDAP